MRAREGETYDTVFMGGVKVKASGCAVIVGDILIKAFWEGFQGVAACGVQTDPIVTETHTDWRVRVRVRVCVCSRVATRGDRQLQSPGTVVTSLFEIIQNRFFSPLSPNCFFSCRFPALSPPPTPSKTSSPSLLCSSTLDFQKMNLFPVRLLCYSELCRTADQKESGFGFSCNKQIRYSLKLLHSPVECHITN